MINNTYHILLCNDIIDKKGRWLVILTRGEHSVGAGGDQKTPTDSDWGRKRGPDCRLDRTRSNYDQLRIGRM